jgi:glycosyltransferase involved in cell wall biosynthesis
MQVARQRVLVFAHDASLYGASQSLLTILQHLVKFVDFLVVLPYGGDIESELNKGGVPYRILPIPRCGKLAPRKFDMPSKIAYYYKQIRARHLIAPIIKSFQPNLLYSNTSVLSFGHYISKIFYIPHIWHIREYGDLDFHIDYLPSREAVANMMEDTSATVFVTEQLRRHWLGKKSSNQYVVYNGVAPTNSFVKSRKPVGDGFKIGIIGAISPSKGQKVAIESMLISVLGMYPSTKLYLYGSIIDNDYYNEIVNFIKYHDLSESIVVKGFVRSHDDIYKELDIVLNCSSSEAFGRTIIEAMGRGIPVIAHAVGGPLEIIEDGMDGFLYRDELEIPSIIQLLVENPNLYTSVSLKGVEKVNTVFSAQRYVAQMQVLFQKYGS